MHDIVVPVAIIQETATKFLDIVLDMLNVELRIQFVHPCLLMRAPPVVQHADVRPGAHVLLVSYAGSLRRKKISTTTSIPSSSQPIHKINN